MARTHSPARNRLMPAGIALLALAAVAALTLGPSSVVAPAKHLVWEAVDHVVTPVLGISPSLNERTLNAMLFVPLGAALALVLPRKGWLLAVLAGLAVSIGVEVLQSGIPGRVTDAGDILWNTLGAFGGAVTVAAVRGLAAAITRARSREP